MWYRRVEGKAGAGGRDGRVWVGVHRIELKKNIKNVHMDKKDTSV